MSHRLITALAAATILSGTALLFASPRAGSEAPASGPEHDHPEIAPHGRMFTPREQDGLIFQIQSVSMNGSMSANPSCPCGYSMYSNFSFNGTIADPLGEHAYRIARVRLDAIDDASGNSLLARGNVTVNPPAHGHKPFVSAQQAGQAISTYFNANVQTQGSLGRPVERIAGAVEVEIAKGIEVVSIGREAMDEARELAPGLSFRLHTFDIASNGNLSIGFNYRAERTGEEQPAFLRFEILDPAGVAIQHVENTTVTVTSTSDIGSYSSILSLGNREIGGVRVRFAKRLDRVVFEFDQRGLGELGL